MKHKKYDVITMGSGLVDAFLDCNLREHNNEIKLPAGTKIAVKKIEFSTGGGGTNTAAAFSHLGLKTGFLGKVAHGGNSYIILKELEKHKVDFLGVRTKNKDEHAGYSIVLVSDKKNRTILTFKGASDTLQVNEVNFSKLKTNWIHFTSMGDGSFITQKAISEYARKNGIKTSFNPSSYQTKFGLKYIHTLVKNAHVLSLNREEAGMLVKGDLAKNLHKLGPEIVVITDGIKTGEVYDGTFRYKYHPNKVNIKGSTGAGDVFVSSFIAGFLKTNNIETAIKIAMANAESVISKQGAKEGLLSWDEVMKRIKKRNYRVRKERA